MELSITPAIEKVWKPNERGQQEILSVPDSVFERLGGGAAGGGKTDLTIMQPVLRQFTEHPKYKGLVMRRTYPDLEKEIIPRSAEWYTPMGAKYNETKKRWTFPSGAKIQFGHAEREQDVRNYDTAEYNTITWEESTHFTGFQYLYLSLSRCRSSSPDLPAFVSSYTNPGNVGHQFFKDRFVRPAYKGRKIIIDKITGQKRIFIPFFGKDNPHLLKNDPGYLARLEGLPEMEKRAKLYGDWDSYEGQVFSEFRVMRLEDEPEYAVHVIAPFNIPDWWPKILAIDWGFAAKTAVIWAAIAPNGRVYIYRTYSCTRTFIKVWAPEVVKLSGEEEFSEVIICHSAQQHRGDELTIREQVSNAFDGKYQIHLAERDRIGGKNLVHEYLRWVQKPRGLTPNIQYNHELANQILRIHGEDRYQEYMNLFVPEPEETNLPKLQIFSHDMTGKENDELINVIPACVPNPSNPEDVLDFDGDDFYDALRMILKTAHRYVSEASEEFQKKQKLQAILDNYKVTNDPTTFYRQMEKLESEDNQGYSIRLHRRQGHHRFSIH